MPGIPKQDGVVERKYKTQLLKQGLTLLFHAYVPKYLWVDAFTTTLFLINRMPTPVLLTLVPIKSYLKKTDYTFS